MLFFLPIPGKEESWFTAVSTSLDGKFINANIGVFLNILIDL